MIIRTRLFGHNTVQRCMFKGMLRLSIQTTIVVLGPGPNHFSDLHPLSTCKNPTAEDIRCFEHEAQINTQSPSPEVVCQRARHARTSWVRRRRQVLGEGHLQDLTVEGLLGQVGFYKSWLLVRHLAGSVPCTGSEAQDLASIGAFGNTSTM